jgi:transcription termination factor Rho
MSVGSQALERSTLEAKDRESLLQIATALGGKPGSRAKKADIIEMILEMAGVTGTPVPAAGAGPSGDADRQLSLDTDEGGREAGDEPEASAPAPAAAPAPTSSANGNGRTATATATASDDEAEADGPTAETGDPGGSGGSGEPGEAERNGSETGRSDDGRERAARNPQHQPRNDDNEPSSRRRRRRGRDRERQGQGQGGSTGMGNQPATPEDFQGEPVEVSGLLDLRDEGYGFLRVKAYLPSKEDVYVSVKQVRQFGLRKGDVLTGAARPASRNEKNPALLRIDEVNGKEPELNKQRSRFEDLTPLPPDERLRLEGPADGESQGDADSDRDEAADRLDALTTRIIDLVAPVGKGQRGLIVSPPRAGKTTLLKRIASAVETNHPDVHLMALLIDERPEEVTEVRRAVQGDVVSSTFDRPADEHTMVAELAIERAKRLVEEGRDVVVLIDGLTRLARAYHLASPPTGRTVAEGVDATALYPAKRIFGAARKVEEGGSLTILATVQVGTGSSLDEVVVEELQAAGNLELRLDRQLAERRTYPAIDVVASSTAQEGALLGADRLPALWQLRRELADLAAHGGPAAALGALVESLGGSATNDELLDRLAPG